MNNNKIVSFVSTFLAAILIATVPRAEVVSHQENVSALGLPITSETAISYSSNDPGTILDFGHERTYGAGFRFDWCLGTEAYYGFHVTTSGSEATLRHYKHVDEATIKSLAIRDDAMNVVRTFDTPTVDSACTIDFSGLEDNRLYYISEVWRQKAFDRDNNINAPVFLRDGIVYTCMYQSAQYGDGAENKARWEKLFADADPRDYLSLDDITYPTSGTQGHVTQVEEWQNKAHEIALNDNWSDEMKVFAFVECLATEYAYDDYRLYTLKGRYRADEYPGDSGYKNDQNYMYYNNVGVCFDFVDTLTIMCREYGIPCTSADNEQHTIAAVWLNDQWMPIDITLLNSYNCPTKDTSKSNWVPNDHLELYAYGGYPKTVFFTHDKQIWTEETALVHD